MWAHCFLFGCLNFLAPKHFSEFFVLGKAERKVTYLWTRFNFTDDLYFSEQGPPQAMLLLHKIAESEEGWLEVVKSLVLSMCNLIFQWAGTTPGHVTATQDSWVRGGMAGGRQVPRPLDTHVGPPGTSCHHTAAGRMSTTYKGLIQPVMFSCPSDREFLYLPMNGKLYISSCCTDNFWSCKVTL